MLIYLKKNLKMREIKYRVIGYGGPLMEVKSLLFNTSVGLVAVTDEGEYRLNDEGVYLMEYTGMKDKNGKEIYEGDITESRLNGRCVVEYRNGSFGIVGGTPHGFRAGEHFGYYPHNHTVIGNIYENPNLLKDEK